ncbi:hypothetical protein [Collimonas arenae]|uniref:hypothetical protein n=1 Tax=Collimonas arenae TaxID=279058 RepID=UPI00056EDADE|nr:hypothetical protein [Collimonas arenae]
MDEDSLDNQAWNGPPGALVEVANDDSEAMRFREGGLMQLKGGPKRSTESIFTVALVASLALGSQPIRCAGVVPGVSMRVNAGARMAAMKMLNTWCLRED